jgi:hypothetical protein
MTVRLESLRFVVSLILLQTGYRSRYFLRCEPFENTASSIDGERFGYMGDKFLFDLEAIAFRNRLPAKWVCRLAIPVRVHTG